MRVTKTNDRPPKKTIWTIRKRFTINQNDAFAVCLQNEMDKVPESRRQAIRQIEGLRK